MTVTEENNKILRYLGAAPTPQSAAMIALHISTRPERGRRGDIIRVATLLRQLSSRGLVAVWRAESNGPQHYSITEDGKAELLRQAMMVPA